jgi:alpha-tubulin suppressor-like RCC1 family protein
MLLLLLAVIISQLLLLTTVVSVVGELSPHADNLASFQRFVRFKKTFFVFFIDFCFTLKTAAATQIDLPEKMISVGCGYAFGVAVSVTGKLYTWGDKNVIGRARNAHHHFPDLLDSGLADKVKQKREEKRKEKISLVV